MTVAAVLDANVRYCRTDVGNSYRWDNAAGTWKPMIVLNSDGTGVPASCGTQSSAVADSSQRNIVHVTASSEPGMRCRSSPHARPPAARSQKRL